MDSNQIVRRRFVFSGRVQGVGFRYQAMAAADAARITGWVRNEYDGTVTMEAQGTQRQIDDAITRIENGRYLRIYNIAVTALAVDPNERSFRIRY